MQEMVMGGWMDLASSWKMSDSKRSPYKASWWAQMRAVLWRSCLATMKEPVLIKVRVLQTVSSVFQRGRKNFVYIIFVQVNDDSIPKRYSNLNFPIIGSLVYCESRILDYVDIEMVGLLIGVIYYGQELDQNGVMNINGAIFVLIINMTFQNVFAVINVFCAELPVFKREHFNGMYRTDVYFLCKTIAEIPVFIAIPVIFISISYYMIGLNPDPERFLMAVITLTLVSNVATSFTLRLLNTEPKLSYAHAQRYLISCVSSNIEMALTIGPMVIIPFLLFGGFFLNNRFSVPIYFKFISYLSWFKYANEALLLNQWEGVDHIDCTASNTTCPKNGLVVIEKLDLVFGNLDIDLLSLTGLIIGFRFLAYLALLSKTYRSY
uniref:ABC-2 type transporter transmembrane domain-containing protein n=1 Tax=Timema douglasi TaxID=61478 RepID=A0A7R8VW26_TIMDO|nr:unnamed protein product [Timema douglasi]